ncbi:MAG: cyclic nucleotide-binding domain-containing protein [Gammaproteobacteria bacterium]|nr:cyclic nucleotide-binding domain-containing protein [Gammaproteobacteria bacterium]
MNDATSGVNLSSFVRLEPIASLQPDQISELAAQAMEQAATKGRPLFKTGDSDNSLWYLMEGEVELRAPDGTTTRIASKTPQSRHPLDNQQPHRCTVTALTPVIFIRIDRELVDTMLAWAQSASSDTEEVIMSGDEIITIDKGALKSKMQHSPNFRKLPAANIDLLLEKMEPMRVHAGEVIIRQGDEGDYFYVIEQGEALVTRIADADEQNNDDSIEMAHLSEGSSFGEAALISDKPRNATVSMQTDGVLLRLNKQEFLTLMQEPMQNWITLEDAGKKIAQGAQWIDVRARNEFQHHHMPGAINIPLNDTHRLAQTLAHDKQYICYCQTGRRSSAAAFILSQYGFEVSVIKGGLPNVESMASPGAA